METMALTSGVNIEINAVHFNIKRIINQVYKLLPMREQGKNWIKPLETLIEQLSGMKRLIVGQDNLFFLILCKMEGLFGLSRAEDLSIYRRTIFECLTLLNELNQNVINY